MLGTIAPLLPPQQGLPVSLRVVLRPESGGPELTREPVTDGDLQDARSELWLAGFLRKGFPDVPLEAVPFRLDPLLRDGARPHCTGFALETTNPAGQQTRCEFSIRAVGDAAERAAGRLLTDGTLPAGSQYYYEVVSERVPPPVSPTFAAEREAAFTLTARNTPLGYLTAPLPPLLQKARTVGAADERWYHVFFTEEALARAERFARKGGCNHPPIETGAVLVGPLCSCPETGELFVVVCEALQVQDAQEAEFSLTYSGKSWARIQAVIRARQAQPATRAHRLLGQCHGHNFPPAAGAPPCELCSKVKVCTRTSVFLSAADRTWSRAVFSRQPWQLCHIFGLNARGERVHSLFGLRDGRLAERGFHVIPEFPMRA